MRVKSLTIGIHSKKVDNNTKLFMLIYSLYVIKNVLFNGNTLTTAIGIDNVNLITTILHIFLLAASFCKIFIITKISKKNLFYLITLLLLGVAVYISTSSVGIVDFILILFSMKDVDYDDTLNFTLGITVLICFTLFSLSCMGVIENITDAKSKIVSRYGMGFNHPNRFGVVIYEIIVLLMYCKKNGNAKYVVSIFLIGMTYYLSRPRSAIVTAILTVFLFFLYEKTDVLKHVSRNIIKIILVIVCMLIAMVIVYLTYHLTINNSLVSRIKLAMMYLKYYRINLFGNELISGNWTRLPGSDYGYFFLDNGPLQFLLSNGIVAFVVYIMCYFYSIKVIIQHKNWRLLIPFVMYGIYSMMESNPMSLAFNPFILMFGYFLIKDKKSISKIV